MSRIEAYDIKAQKITMKNPQPYLMKNGSWALKRTSSEIGIVLFRIVGRNQKFPSPNLKLSKICFQASNVNIKKSASFIFSRVKYEMLIY